MPINENNPYQSPMTIGATPRKRVESLFLRFFWIIIPVAMVVGSAIGSTLTYWILKS